MCTAISFSDHYFGRNLDLEYCYREAVTVTPRNFPLRSGSPSTQHLAIIGIATVSRNYPLYYDGVNEAGVAMAALSFPGNACYGTAPKKQHAIAPYDLIPWVLGQVTDARQAARLLQSTSLTDTPFSPELPLTDLHWFFCDSTCSFTAEPGKNGLVITPNPVGVLTNNPPFDYHLHNLCNYMRLSECDPANTFAPGIPLRPYSNGMGAMGLPGDLSSASRFIRAAYTKLHCLQPDGELACVNQVFHILGSVAQQEGCVRVGDQYEKTQYSCCCSTHQGIYYYTTYENAQPTAVHLRHERLDGKELVTYPLLRSPQIRMEN